MDALEHYLEALVSKPEALPFTAPVDALALGIPDYFAIIAHPMDLGTVLRRIRKQEYASPTECAKDVRLVFRNAMTYNTPNSAVYQQARALHNDFDTKFQNL
ncbi:Transcription factor GTE3 [Pelomyxa schiedti]|nr:Transcription factor GTE3 [Pelomyxa schiedti]